jgi:hypothetical protein
MEKGMSMPLLYQGKKIPINELSPSEFESFMYGVLRAIFQNRGISIEGQPGSTGDGGFDVDGKDKKGNIICFQCKQYPKAEINLKSVSNELAKVALRSYKEGSHIAEHYIISSGNVTNEVDSARRSGSKKAFIEQAAKEVKNANNFINDKKAILKTDKNIHFEKIVTDYIERLKTLQIWNSGQLESEIGIVYSKIIELIEQYFQVEVVLREYSRPDFNENEYLNGIDDNKQLINLNYSKVQFIENIYSKSYADNSRRNQSEQLEQNIEMETSLFGLDKLISLDSNFIMILGDGGFGKTTTCKQLLSYYAKKRMENKDALLPIYIEFDKCGENIDMTINKKLDIINGTWRSLPLRIILIFDGLNEIEHRIRKALINQLDEIISHLKGRVFFVITTRNPASFNIPLLMPFFNENNVYKIEKLNRNQMDQLIDIYFTEDEKVYFIKELNRNINPANRFFFEYPFGFQLIINFYKDKKVFPDSIPQTLDQYYDLRFKRNKESAQGNVLENLSFLSFMDFVNRFAYVWRVVNKYHNSPIDVVQKVVLDTLDLIKNDRIFGFSNIDENDLLNLLKYNEIIISDNNYWYFQHDIFADYFSAKYYAYLWDNEKIDIEKEISNDILYFLSYCIKNKKDVFINKLKEISIDTAANCCMQMGQEYIEIVEKYIIDNINLTNKFKVIMYFQASSIMNTVKLRDKLFEISERLPKNSYLNIDIINLARKFLCIMGDERVLSDVCNNAEHSKAMPLNISGGDISLWEAANIDAKINISRKRLVNGEAECFLSIQTLCSNGDKNDIPLITNAILNNKNIHIILHGLWFLAMIDRDKSLSLIQEYLEKNDIIEIKLSFIELKFLLGNQEDIQYLIDTLTSIEFDSDVARINSCDKIVRLLSDASFSEYQIDSIINILKNANFKNKLYFYKLITLMKIKECDTIMLNILHSSNDINEIYYLLLYFSSIEIEENLFEMYKKVIDEKYITYQTRVELPLYAELIKSRNSYESNEIVINDLIKYFDKDMKEQHDTDNETEVFPKIESKILGYINSFSYLVTVENIDDIMNRLIKTNKLPSFNQDEQKKALSTIFKCLKDDKIECYFSQWSLSHADQLFLFKIADQIFEPSEYILNKYKELLRWSFIKWRPDFVLFGLEKHWNKDIFNIILDELLSFGKESHTSQDIGYFIQMFNEVNGVVVKKIFVDGDNLSEYFPIVIEPDINKEIQDILKFWNSCYENRN